MQAPPRIAQRLFERLLTPEYNAVLGDLEEDYHDRAAYYGSRRAALRCGKNQRGAQQHALPAFKLKPDQHSQAQRGHRLD